jgi:ABC-type multidrug transport system fused ATPase/permease subunit
MWRIIHEPRLRTPEVGEGDARAVRRLFVRHYLRYWPALLVVIVGHALMGQALYVYAWTGQIIADDVVQVQLLAKDQPAAAQIDPAQRNQLFAVDATDARAAGEEDVAAGGAKSTREKLRTLAFVAAMMFLVEILHHIISFVSQERLVYVGHKVQFRLRQQLHDKLMLLPLSYHDRHAPGKLMTHLFSDVDVIRMHMISLICALPMQLMIVAVGLAILLSIDPWLSLVVLPAVPAYAAVYNLFRRRLEVVNDNLREREGRLNGLVANRIGNFLMVKAFVREVREAIEYLRQAKPLMSESIAASLLSVAFGVSCAIVTGLSLAAVLWLGALKVRDGQMTLGTLLMFYAAAGALFGPVAGLTGQVAILHRVRAVASRILRVLDEPIALSDCDEPLPLPAGPCEVRFNQVTMRYETDRPAALAQVSFVLPRGKRLCVMGPSGSGKTTLAKLACRLYDPVEGVVRYDEVDVKRFRTADLRRHSGMVSQEPVVFSGTIAENIRYGSTTADHQSLIQAARYAQIQEFIEQLPRQYRTLTTERGLTLSGGQKQRLNLARALLSDPKVLILDDCTSALDAQTEAQLIEAFDDALRDRTVLIVSHRVSLAMECDLVLMLDGGRLVEFGPPQQLLQEQGPFAMLHRGQAEKSQFVQTLCVTAS